MDFDAFYGDQLSGFGFYQKVVSTVAVSSNALTALCMTETVFSTSVPEETLSQKLQNYTVRCNKQNPLTAIENASFDGEFYQGTIAIEVMIW